ncbi:MAG: stage III sporulation protein AC [Clostridia bacterium]|nr:stage III sporulation protein AC [Clostridia bacterium]
MRYSENQYERHNNGVDIIFKIAGIGIIVAVVCQLLKQTGRDDIAMLTALAGLVVVLSMVIGLIATLFNSIKSVFDIY